MPIFPRTRRIILKYFPGKDDAVRFADAEGWAKYSDTMRGPDGVGVTEALWGVRPGLTFFYVENDLSDDCAVGFMSREEFNEIEIQRLLQEVDDRFDGWSTDELLFKVDSAETLADFARGIIRLGLGAPPVFDEDFFGRINRATTHPEHAVRETAVAAMSYPAWKQFRPILRSIAQNDSAENVRARAEYVLDIYDMAGVPEQ